MSSLLEQGLTSRMHRMGNEPLPNPARLTVGERRIESQRAVGFSTSDDGKK
jgi:hypothetical protein